MIISLLHLVDRMFNAKKQCLIQFVKTCVRSFLHDGMLSWKLSVLVGGVAEFPRQNTQVAARRYDQATKLELPGSDR